MALSALDRAKVALAAHLIFHGAKQNGVRASSADGCLVVEIDPVGCGRLGAWYICGLHSGPTRRRGELNPVTLTLACPCELKEQVRVSKALRGLQKNVGRGPRQKCS